MRGDKYVYNEDGIKVGMEFDGDGRVVLIFGLIDNREVLIITEQNGEFKVDMIAGIPFDLVKMRRYITCYDAALSMIE